MYSPASPADNLQPTDPSDIEKIFAPIMKNQNGGGSYKENEFVTRNITHDGVVIDENK